MASRLARPRALSLLVLAASLAACAPAELGGNAVQSTASGAAPAAPSPTAGFLANTSTTGGVIFFPSAGRDLPAPVQTPVTGIPESCELPQGAAYYEADHALVACLGASKVLVVQASTAEVIDTIDTTGTYDGSGTIAVAPSLAYALGASGDKLSVIQAPFAAGAPITTLTLAGTIPSYQGEAIVFDPDGNAYVRTGVDITVVPPPYTAIGYQIPLANGGAIGITPDGGQLLVPVKNGSAVQIFDAPFSATSTPVTLSIPGSNLNGIAVSPTGADAILGSRAASQAWVIHAPFSASSGVEALPVPASVGTFEDVSISSDGQLAVITGNDTSGAGPLIVVQAPFTAAGATAHSVTVTGGRGAGSFRFVPPGLAAGPTLSAAAPESVAAGGDFTVTLTYGNSGEGDLANAVIEAAVPAGATFASATGGGALADGIVTWTVASVPAGASGLTVSVTLHATAAAGESIGVSAAGIRGDGTAVVFAQPLQVAVTSVCGNGIAELEEECDDHGTAGGDGCSALCLEEASYAVSFETDGTAGASLTGEASQDVFETGSASPVTAVAPSGYRFTGWTGTGGFAATSANPLTVTGVTGPMTITAHFAKKPKSSSCSTGGGETTALGALVVLAVLGAAKRRRRAGASR